MYIYIYTYTYIYLSRQGQNVLIIPFSQKKLGDFRQHGLQRWCLSGGPWVLEASLPKPPLGGRYEEQWSCCASFDGSTQEILRDSDIKDKLCIYIYIHTCVYFYMCIDIGYIYIYQQIQRYDISLNSESPFTSNEEEIVLHFKMLQCWLWYFLCVICIE